MPEINRNGVGKGAPSGDQWVVDEAIDESFPASDPPSWTLGPSTGPAITPGATGLPSAQRGARVPWGVGAAALALLALGAGRKPRAVFRLALLAGAFYGGYRWMTARPH